MRVVSCVFLISVIVGAACGFDVKCANSACNSSVEIQEVVAGHATYVLSDLSKGFSRDGAKLTIRGPAAVSVTELTYNCNCGIKLPNQHVQIDCNDDSIVLPFAVNLPDDDDYSIELSDIDECLEFLMKITDTSKVGSRGSSKGRGSSKERAVKAKASAADCSSSDFAVELLVLADMSAQTEENLEDSKVGISNLIHSFPKKFSSFSVGVSSYIDKPLLPFGIATDYCYSEHLPLAHYAASKNSMDDVIGEISVGDGGDAKNEVLGAILRATASSGWTSEERDGQGRYVLRGIVLATNSLWHERGDSGLAALTRGATMDNDDCNKKDYPTVEEVGSALKSKGISLLVASPSDLAPAYKNLLNEMGCAGYVLDVEDKKDISGFMEVVLQGVSQICTA